MPELMTNVLARMVSQKRKEVACREGVVSYASLIDAARSSTRDFGAALAAPGARFIMECKKASPSRGLIRAGLNARAVAEAYDGVADAVSVLTDATFFQGSHADLATVASIVDVPVLCKDIVVASYQVVEARVHGADAILLMLSVLDDGEARRFMALARAFGMDCLVEVHDERELARAIEIGAPIIGINNRNLSNLEVDLKVTERLAPLAPADRLVVTESGLKSRADVHRLAAHADAFLVGSALMARTDLAQAARELVFGRVKVCGLTRRADLIGAAKSGASFGGLVLATDSPRGLELGEGRQLAEEAPIPLIGVFRNHTKAFVGEAAATLKLRGVQLHGAEDARYIGDLRTQLGPDVFVWKAVPVSMSAPPAQVRERSGADRLLFDGSSPGSGASFDWSLIGQHPALADSLLAGGLRCETAMAASRMGAWALDVCSGLEVTPGVKSQAAMHEFFAALRAPTRVVKHEQDDLA